MFPCAIKMFIAVLVLFIAVTFADGQDRQLASEINPGCIECDATRDPLIYVRAKGTKDTIHQLWDFTDHEPSVVFHIGSSNSTLNVQWTERTQNRRPHPIKFKFFDQFNDTYSFAAAIDSIIEYNDIKDNGQYEPDSGVRQKVWPLDRTWWHVTDSSLVDNKEAMVMLRGEQDGSEGVIEMKLDVLPFKDYAVDLPHLIHTSNSTLVDIRLVNWTESNHFNSSRFGIRTVLVSSDPSTGSWAAAMRKSLDDEHTPGVFEIIEVKSSRLATSGAGGGGYLQFRPVCYTEPLRTVSSSTNAYITHIDSSSNSSLPRLGILGALYRDPANTVVQQAVVSFGISGDGFYKQHNFTSWSFAIGYGTPPVEGFSIFVLIIISIGLGVPLLLTVSGILYLLIKRFKNRNPPTMFTNDE